MADIKEAFQEKNEIYDLWNNRIPVKRNVDWFRNAEIYQYKLKHNLTRQLDRCGSCGKPRKEHLPWAKHYSGFSIVSDKFVETEI